MDTTKLQPIMQKFVELINADGGKMRTALEKALEIVHQKNVVEYMNIRTLDDYIEWNDKNLTTPWLENRYGTATLEKYKAMYYLLDVAPVGQYQNPEVPRPTDPALTPLSEWMREYQIALGQWMDNPAQLTPEVEKSFMEAATYNMDEYVRPRGGWKTVNQLFARRTKPGYRPIAAIDDDKVIVHPADACFGGQWEIRPDTHVRIKGLDWSIDELLEGSPYKDKFKGGMWCHSFLSWTDYHRQHAPLSGIVREARVIQGACYVDLVAVPDKVNPATNQVEAWRATAPDEAGYEFMQTRGLIVLETKYGYVAILPIAMPQVSSVVVTAEEGVALKKGDEISYFQFGGSDIVYLFSANMNVSMTAHKGTHYKVGTKIGEVYPVVEL